MQPAFPFNHYDLAEGEHGISIRDYFAGKAMQAFLTHLNASTSITPDECADESYRFADAMLKARGKQ